MNEQTFRDKYAWAMDEIYEADVKALLESIRADERANAVTIAETMRVDFDQKFETATDPLMKRIYFIKRVAARLLRDRIRSSERAAPVDGVAEEPKAGEWVCNTCSKRLGTDVRVARCPDHPTGTVHKFQHAKPLPTGTPCAVCGCDGSDSSHNSCAECVCWSVGDGHGFGIVPHRVTPDPAAAVTVDEADNTERIPWYKTEEGVPNEGEWVEVSSTTHSPVFVRQYLGSSSAQDWRSPTDVGEHPRHFWPFWRRNPATCPPTAPPVANEWVDSTAELPEVNRYVSVREDESLEPYREPRFWNDGWWLVPENGSAPVLMYKDADCYAQWRYIVEPSTSDTVEGDTPNWEQIAKQETSAKVALEIQIADKRLELDRTVRGWRELDELRQKTIDGLRGKCTNQAKELRRLNSAHIAMKAERDQWEDECGKVRAEGDDEEVAAYYQVMSDQLYWELVEARTKRDRLARTCGEYERTVTGLRVELEETKLAVEDLVNTLREVANITGDWAAPERE